MSTYQLCLDTSPRRMSFTRHSALPAFVEIPCDVLGHHTLLKSIHRYFQYVAYELFLKKKEKLPFSSGQLMPAIVVNVQKNDDYLGYANLSKVHQRQLQIIVPTLEQHYEAPFDPQIWGVDKRKYLEQKPVLHVSLTQLS